MNDLAVSYSDLDKIFNSDEDELAVSVNRKLWLSPCSGAAVRILLIIRIISFNLWFIFCLFFCLHSLDVKELALLQMTSLRVKRRKPQH